MRIFLLKQHFPIVFFGAALIFVSFAYAQDVQQNNPLEELAANGPGVYNIKVDKETGKIKSLIVVGAAPIKPWLGPMSKDHAINEASIYCAAEFARWTAGSKITVSSDGDIRYDEDEELNKTHLRLMTLFLQHAETLYCNVDAKNKEYIVIKGLNIEKVMAAKKSAQAHNNDAPAKPAK